MKIKVSKAEDIVLDYLVAKCKGEEVRLIKGQLETLWTDNGYKPSTSWAQGGPIIERERITTCWEGTIWVATLFNKNCDETWYGNQSGPTPLVAAMRCYVASKLGDEVDVPDELMGVGK